MVYTQVWDRSATAINEHIIKRDEDGAFIPFDNGNTDYQEYKAWLEEGNTPTPIEPPPLPPEPEPPVDPLPVPPAQAYQELLDLTERVEALENQVKGMRVK